MYFFYMQAQKNILYRCVLITVAVLLLDQVLKIWVKTHFTLGESIKITNWFFIYFIENNGMAFGVELFSKIFLSVFRILAVIFIAYFIYSSIKKEKYPQGFLYAVTLIFAGALGNIIDSVFYGVLFTKSTPFSVATIFPIEGGYAPWFYGKVVDMFYFPLVETTFPTWIPIWGGQDFVFFSPIFNLADASITIGAFIILLFYRTLLKTENKEG